MAYRPPTTSKYAPPPLTPSDQTSSPFVQRKRESRETENGQDWSAFGGKRRNTEALPPISGTSADASAAELNMIGANRNSLSAYLHMATKDKPLSSTSSQAKWEQSAIRRKPTSDLPPVCQKPNIQSHEMFPTLGGSSTSPSDTKKMEKSSSSVSLAERMKIRLQEEEAEKKRQEERTLAQARAHEEEERRNRMLGVLTGTYIRSSVKRFEKLDYDLDDDVDPTEDLEYDAYGQPYDHGRYYADDHELDTHADVGSPDHY